MGYTTTAAIIREPHGQFTLENVVLDDIRKDEMLVRIQACGICHTDYKFQEVVSLPAVLGHEGTGIVEIVGEDVESFKPGDRVILSYPSCGECPYCNDNKLYLCEKIIPLKFACQRLDGTKTIRLGDEPVSGAFFQQSSFATHAIVPERLAVPIESDYPPEMFAALPCGIQTGAGAILNTFRVNADDSIIIFGAGTVGLSGVMAAKASGATTIIVVDVIHSRLEISLELGATHVFNATEGDIPAKVKDLSPHGMRYALETSSTVQGLEDAIECLGQGGKVGIVSTPVDGNKFPFTTRELFKRVASLQGIIQGSSIPRTFLPGLLALHRNGLFPFEKLITTYDFTEINQAFKDAESGKVIKPVLKMT